MKSAQTTQFSCLRDAVSENWCKQRWELLQSDRLAYYQSHTSFSRPDKERSVGIVTLVRGSVACIWCPEFGDGLIKDVMATDGLKIGAWVRFYPT